MLQDKLMIECESKVDLIDVRNVIQIFNDSVCTEFHMSNGEKLICSKSLKFFETKLPQYFYRTNRNTIINLIYVVKVNKKARTITLTNNHTTTISVRNLKGLLEHLNENSLH